MATCPGDCTTGGGGGGNAMCGDAVCDSTGGESAATCPLDCGGGGNGSTCPGDAVECFFCWFDPTTCVPPQNEQICGQCWGVGP
jgi:hypothetical protein